MNKTKEEILEKHTGETGIYLTKGMVRGSDALEAMDEYTTHLTDQIKSMEGQVKELRDENEIQGNYNDMLIKELESLQKENERLYDALSNIMNNERWLEMNIDTVNNLLSKHA